MKRLEMKLDCSKPFNIPFVLLRTVGLWQNESSTWYYCLYGLFLLIFFMISFTTSHTIYLFKMIKSGSIKDVSEVLSVFLTVFGVVLKAIWFKVKLKKIKEMENTISKLLKFASLVKKPKIEAKVVKMTKVIKFYFASAFIACTAAMVQFCFTHRNKRLPYETWFYWDFKTNDALFWSLAVYQYGMSVYGSICSCSFDIIPIIFISLTTVALEELAAEVLTIEKCARVTKSRKSDVSKKLKKCIEQHVKIKTFAKEISENLSLVFLLQALLSSVILCTAAFLLTTVSLSNDF